MKMFAPLTATLLTTALLSGAAQALDVDESAPAFDLPAFANSAEDTIALEDYQGKVVYVDFWASWCGPCRRSFPKLEALHQKYQDQGFEVVAINLDEEADAGHEFLERYPVSFTIARDATGDVAEQYQLKGMPSAYLLDQQGVVQQVVVGFHEGDGEQIEANVKQLLNQ